VPVKDGPGSQQNQAPARPSAHRLRSTPYPEFGAYRCYVEFGRVLGDTQGPSDVLVGVSLRDELKDLPLARGQSDSGAFETRNSRASDRGGGQRGTQRRQPSVGRADGAVQLLGRRVPSQTCPAVQTAASTATVANPSPAVAGADYDRHSPFG